MSDEQTEITKYMSEEECWCEETVEEYEKMCMPCRIKHEREQHLATIERLTAERDTLNKELLRVRTTQSGSAHALDRVRQHLGLDLIPQEHPEKTVGRIEREIESRNENSAMHLNEVDSLTAERDAAVEREGRLREDLDTAHTVALKAPELNPSNYGHDQVCELNTAMCEVFSILDGLLKENSNGE